MATSKAKLESTGTLDCRHNAGEARVWKSAINSVFAIRSWTPSEVIEIFDVGPVLELKIPIEQGECVKMLEWTRGTNCTQFVRTSVRCISLLVP